MRTQRSQLLAVMFLVCAMVAFLPATGRAAGYLMTGFVPELATPTVELHYGYHADSILTRSLNVSTATARLAYVAYPGLEVGLDLNYLRYGFDLGDTSESGYGTDLLGRYQLPAFLEGIDLAAAAVVSFGKSDHITDYGATGLFLVSSDIDQGLTPCGGIGFSLNRQKFDGGATLYSVYETRFDPVLFLGFKYLWENTLGAQVEAGYQDGFSLAASVSYRF